MIVPPREQEHYIMEAENQTRGHLKENRSRRPHRKSQDSSGVLDALSLKSDAGNAAVNNRRPSAWKNKDHNGSRHQALYSSHKNVLSLSRHHAPIQIPSPKHGATGASSLDFHSADKSGPGFFETLVSTKRASWSQKKIIGENDEEDNIEIAMDFDDETLEAVRDTFPVFFEDPILPEESDRRCHLMSIFTSINATMPWQQDSLKSNFLQFIASCLRGIGQVYFMNNPVTGLLILIAMFVQSTRIAIHGIIALVCGTAAALFLGFDVGLARSGLFGYNAFLVGLAIATFDSTSQHSDYSISIIISSIVCSSFSAVIFVMLGKLLVPYKSPPLTLPFNMATILLLAASANMSYVSIPPVSTPALPDYESAPFDGITAQAFFAGTIRGIGQVFLADNIISGVLVLIGLMVCSRISAVAALLGSALGAASALALGVPGSAVEQGMFGFNASLTVTAMFMFYTPSFGAGVLATLAGFMTVVCQQALATILEPLGLPFMTLPFCLVGLPFIIIQGTTSIVIAVPLSSMTIPEDHLKGRPNA